MDNIKDDNYYLDKIISNLKFAIDSMNNVSIEDFSENTILVNAIMFSFVQISENASRLSNECKTSLKNVSWNEIRGIRNKIVHDYDIIDNTTIYNTVIYDFPVLLEELVKK